MKYIKTYNEHNDTLVLEKLNLKSMINKFKETKNKKIAKIIIVGLLSIYSITQANNYINQQNLDRESADLLKAELKADSLLNVKLKKDSLAQYKNPTKMVLSQEGWDQIRIEEGSPKQKGEPVLKAYKLGDGMVTIGYGHAERIKQTIKDTYQAKKYFDTYNVYAVVNGKEIKIEKKDIKNYKKFVMKSKYKVGDTITKEQANKLFIKDVNYAAKGVKDMFAKWEKEGIDVRITQEQYDVLVSIAFNKGLGGFKNSKFIKSLKDGNHEETSELIKAEGDTAKFAGVKKRREREAEKFLS